MVRLIIELTNRCNLRCQHCFAERHAATGDLPLTILDKVLHEGKDCGVAHLLRTAKGLAEHPEAGRARFGHRVHGELQRLCHMGTERPTVGQWRVWYVRFRALLIQHTGGADKSGTSARHLQREGKSLWTFLDVPGVEATNNIAERAHRFGVLWRKRRQETDSEKGNHWVERVLSLRHTCRLRGRPTFPILVEAISCLFKGERPDLSWISQHESLQRVLPRDQLP